MPYQLLGKLRKTTIQAVSEYFAKTFVQDFRQKKKRIEDSLEFLDGFVPSRHSLWNPAISNVG